MDHSETHFHHNNKELLLWQTHIADKKITERKNRNNHLKAFRQLSNESNVPITLVTQSIKKPTFEHNQSFSLNLCKYLYR